MDQKYTNDAIFQYDKDFDENLKRLKNQNVIKEAIDL